MSKSKLIVRRRMRDIKAEGRSRRAKLLSEYTRACLELPGITLTEFGKRYKLTGERIGQMLKKARAENA